MPELNVTPEAAEWLADHAESEEDEQFYRDMAEGKVDNTTQVDKQKADRLVAHIIVKDTLDNFEEKFTDLDDFDRGEIHGRLKMLEFFLDNTEHVEWAEDADQDEMMPKEVRSQESDA